MIKKWVSIIFRKSSRYFSTEHNINLNIDTTFGFISNLPDRRIYSLTGKEAPKLIDSVVINDTKQFFTDYNIRGMNCLILDNKSPKILFDFFLYRPFLEEMPDLGDEYWVDAHESIGSSLIHYLMKYSDNHSLFDVRSTDVSNVIKVQTVQSPYGLSEGNEGFIFPSLQLSAPKFAAENDPTVILS